MGTAVGVGEVRKVFVFAGAFVDGIPVKFYVSTRLRYELAFCLYRG